MGASTSYIPKVTFRRWVEDRLDILGVSKEQMHQAFGRHSMNKWMVTELLKNPKDARAKHIRALRDVLQLDGDDWYPELVEQFGVGTDKTTPNEFNKLLQEDGYQLGRVQHAA